MNDETIERLKGYLMHAPSCSKVRSRKFDTDLPCNCGLDEAVKDFEKAVTK